MVTKNGYLEAVYIIWLYVNITEYEHYYDINITFIMFKFAKHNLFTNQ